MIPFLATEDGYTVDGEVLGAVVPVEPVVVHVLTGHANVVGVAGVAQEQFNFEYLLLLRHQSSVVYRSETG